MMSRGYSTTMRSSRYSGCSLYLVILMLLLILEQENTMGAAVLPLDGADASRDTQREMVGEDSPFCRYRRKILSCDFKWINKEVVLPTRPNCTEAVERIFVRHVNNLRLNRGSCYHLSLTHITEMTLEGEEVSDCSCQNFRLQNTTANTLPSTVSNLYVHESNITNIALNTVLEQLTIIGSTIGELSFNSIINSTLTVKLHSTTIDVISGLRLSEPASLFIQNCTVKNIPDGALVLGSGQNILNQLRLGESSHSGTPVISLKNGGDMMMENMEGKVQIKVKSDDEFDSQLKLNNTEMLKMENKQCDTLPQSNNIVIIIILAVFLSVSVILNVALLLYEQPRKLIYKLLSKSNSNEKLKRNISSSHNIHDQKESCESEGFITSKSPTKPQLRRNENFPDILQNSERTARKRLMSLNIPANNNNNEIKSKDKLSPIEEHKRSPPRRRYKSESGTSFFGDESETNSSVFLETPSIDKRLSHHSNLSFIAD